MNDTVNGIFIGFLICVGWRILETLIEQFKKDFA